jgi:hypothetical protein
MKLLADHNFNHAILRGLLLRNPRIDLVRAYDVGLSQVSDPILLEWAAFEQRVLLTHDVSTITKYVYERLDAGQAMPGVIEVPCTVRIGKAIEDIWLLLECSLENELEGQIIYVPLI